MTVIVGFVDQNNVVWMGADSAVCDSWHSRVLAGSKIVKLQIANDVLLIGVTGTMRINQLIQYQMELLYRPSEMSTEEYLVTLFVPQLRKCLKEYGWGIKEDNQDRMCGGLLIGYRGTLHLVADQYQVNRYKDNYSAVGCGRDLALGAFCALAESGVDLSPIMLLNRALSAAAKFSNGVQGPWAYESTGELDRVARIIEKVELDK